MTNLELVETRFEKVKARSTVKLEGRIPEWFIRESLNDAEQYVASVGDWSIVKETEKAINIQIDSKFEKIWFWCPKSILIDEDEALSKEITKAINLEIGRLYNEYLVTMAKEAGLVARKGTKTSTLIKKLDSAGITYMTKDDFKMAEAQ